MPAKSTKNLPNIRKCELSASTVIDDIFLSGNAEMPIFETDRGMQIDLSDVQFVNACDPISVSFEPNSNDTVARDVQDSKHFSHRISTEVGIQIDLNAEQCENAFFAIRFTLEPASNDTVESEPQPEKLFLLRT
jgi:hypothetical protein